MNWDDLRIFLAVARGGTLSAAARLTGQDATTVARRLRRLETRLATTLFEHGPAGHVLTDGGHRLLPRAEAMEASARAVAQQAEGGLPAGTIRVAVPEGFGTHFIAARLGGFADAHPDITVDLIASTGLLSPSRRESDVAIMLARPTGGPLVVAKLADYRLGLYAAQAWLAANGPVATVSALLERRLAGYVPDRIDAPELRYLAEIDERLAPRLRSSSILAQACLVETGAACGILPCFLGDTLPGVVRLLGDAVRIERRFWLVVHRDERHLARIEAFVGWLRAETAAARTLLSGA